MDIDHKNDKMA